MTSAEVLARLQDGMPYRSELHRLVRSVFRNEPALADQADDVLQDAWIAANKAVQHSSQQVKNLRAWLTTIVRRTALKALAETRGQRFEALLETKLPTSDAVDVVATKELAERLMQALSARQATVLGDVLVGGRSIEEIAATSGMQEKSVRSLLSRVRQALKAQGYDVDLGVGE